VIPLLSVAAAVSASAVFSDSVCENPNCTIKVSVINKEKRRFIEKKY
jgi:hypothetical protein